MTIRCFISSGKDRKRSVKKVKAVKKERFILGKPIEDSVEDIVKLVGFSPIRVCYIVINAELFCSSELRFFCPESENSSKVRDELLREIFKKGVTKVL